MQPFPDESIPTEIWDNKGFLSHPVRGGNSKPLRFCYLFFAALFPLPDIKNPLLSTEVSNPLFLHRKITQNDILRPRALVGAL